MMLYPIALNLRNREVIVIGGGKVALRRVRDLLAAGAEIMLISPTLHPDLAALSEQLTHQPTAYTPGMLTNMIQWDMNPLLIFACTNSRVVNQQIAQEARELGLLVSVADGSSTSNFAPMAAVHHESITVAVSTGGASPALAAHLRKKLEGVSAGEYAILARWMGELRPKVRAAVTPEARRRESVAGDPGFARIGSFAIW